MMMKRAIALLLLMALALGCLPALAESAPADIPEGAVLLNPMQAEADEGDDDGETQGAESGGLLFLPLGAWSLSEGAAWHFITETTATLTPAQQAAAEAEGIDRWWE